MIEALFQDATLIQSVGSIAAIVLTFFARQYVGAFLDEKAMNLLHEAVKSAVVNTLSGRPDMAVEELREFVAQHLARSIPKTMKKLMPNLLNRVGVPKGATNFVTSEVLDPILTTLVNRYRTEALSIMDMQPRAG